MQDAAWENCREPLCACLHAEQNLWWQASGCRKPPRWWNHTTSTPKVAQRPPTLTGALGHDGIEPSPSVRDGEAQKEQQLLGKQGVPTAGLPNHLTGRNIEEQCQNSILSREEISPPICNLK